MPTLSFPLALIAMVTGKAGGARFCRASDARLGSLVFVLESAGNYGSFLITVRDG